MISIIHPSRGRPDIAKKVAQDWISKAGSAVEYILSVDIDDPLVGHYQRPFPFTSSVPLRRIMSDNKNAIEAINSAAKVAVGDIFIVISDDFHCPENWGWMIEAATQGKKDWIMKTPDGIQDWIITLPIMDRVYYERFGFIYNPVYKHAWCDTEMTCVAELLGKKIVTDIPFIHNHYSIGGLKDSISDRADAHFEDGRKKFIERLQQKFHLPYTPGKLSDNFYTRIQP